MKVLIYLLVIVVAAAAGYFTHPAIYNMIDNSRPKTQVTAVENTGPKVATMPQGSQVDAGELAKLQEKLRGSAPTGETPAGDAPANPPPPPPPAEDEFAKKYPLPNFKPIEEITKDWTYIPARVFPRKVMSKVDVDFHVAGGKATVPKGSELFAIGMADGMLIVSRDGEGTLKEQIPLAGVDLQETMIDLYEKFKKRTTDRVLALRAKAKYEKENPGPPPTPDDERVKLAGPKPAMNAEGQIPEMAASIQNKEVTEFKLPQIITWNPVDFQMDGANGYWTGTVTVRMSTLFGDVDTEVTAFMSKGKVAKWIYSGSKEPVQ